MTSQKKLLIVDDSKVMRDAVADMYASDSSIQVVAEATNGAEAISLAEKYKPDVITMDVSMPVMDGISALKHIMIKNPRPVVMLSSLTMEGARVAFDALRYGAVDFISKPSALSGMDLTEQEAEIRSKVEYASEVSVSTIKYIRSINPHAQANKTAVSGNAKNKVVAMGAAEGGYGALLKLIPQLRADIDVSYLVTLYVSPEHLDAFATYLDSYSAVRVKRAMHDEIIKPGVCYLSSGADYMTLHKQNDAYALHVSPAPFASRKGAVDMLFFSTADLLETNSSGIILSGLGADGSEGLEEVMRMGGNAIVQDPKTCLCKDMALASIERCHPELIVPDLDIVPTLDRVFGINGSVGHETTSATG